MIKRYFLVKTEHLPHNLGTHNLGEYHYLNLESGNHLLVLFDQYKVIPYQWEFLPHLLSQETVSKEHQEKLAHLGVQLDHNAYTMAKQIAKTHPQFEP